MEMLTGTPWPLAAAVAGVIALVYSFIWPRPKSQPISSWMLVVLRWAHAAVWWILVAVCLIKSGLINAPGGLVAPLASSAFGFYVLFLATLFLDRSRARRHGSWEETK